MHNIIDPIATKQFLATLSTRRYELLSKAEFRRIKDFVQSDGCTSVPDFYVTACIVHDFYYRTHLDLYGNPITKGHADKLLRAHIQHESKLKKVSIISYIWFYGVKFLGRKSWT